MTEALQHSGVVPITMMLAAFGISRATFYRQRARTRQAVDPSPRPTPNRALSESERKQVLGELNSERFQDKAPAQVHATLLEEGTYLCSTRTMYRILADNEQVRERRAQARHPVYARPELIATAPNQVWSWDITKLKTFEKFVYLNLYVMLDIFSRYVVGWMVAEKDNATLAERFLRETIKTHSVDPSKLTSHSDRGASMRALTVAQLLAQLNVTQSFSRPRVSNDNPFSESQFKTTKYDCEFPEKFGGIDDALKFCREYFPRYNHEHHHSGIAYLTPATVHFGRVEEVLATRDATLMAAYEQHPERFSKPPRSPRPPSVVYINAPRTEETGGPEKPESGNSEPSKELAPDAGPSAGDQINSGSDHAAGELQ